MLRPSKRVRKGWFGELIAFTICALLIINAVVTVNLLAKLYDDGKSDMVSVSNGAFVIVTAFAALAFSFAQALPDDKESRARLVLAGEVLIATSMALLVSIVTRQGLLHGGFDWVSKDEQTRASFMQAMNVVAAVLFLGAIGFGHLGVGMVALAILRRKKG